jgi:hypothetical protein
MWALQQQEEALVNVKPAATNARQSALAEAGRA